MPLPGDLVHQTSITAGTGAQTLVAVLGKRSFLSAFGTGGTNTFDYYISHRTAAEHERGTGHESGGTLVRDTVLANHLGTTALVNFSAGIKDITNDVPANQRVLLDYPQTLTNKVIGTPTAVGDANYTILAANAFVYTSAAFTAARTWTLPSAASYRAGVPLTIADLFGTLTATNTLTIARAGSDTINGLTAVVMGSAFQSLTFESDGVSKFVITTGLPLASTGDLKVTHKTTADPTWIMWSDGTVGNASSSATIRANADTFSLFALYFGYAESVCPLYNSGGFSITRASVGGTAASAWSNNCRQAVPLGAGRKLTLLGSGAGLTARSTLGQANVGAESVSPSVATTASHAHTAQVLTTAIGFPYGNDFNVMSALTGYEGGGAPSPILDPETVVNVMIKL
jgi:hypothetical protein